MTNNYSVEKIFALCAQHWPETHTPIHHYVLNLHRLSARESAQADQLAKEAGLTLTEFDLLATLRRAEPPHVVNPTVLQRSTLLSSGGLTKILYQMEERGLVERSVAEDDKRGKLVHLTVKGKMLAEQVMADILSQKTQAQSAAGLTVEELNQLNTLLGKLLSPLEADA